MQSGYKENKLEQTALFLLTSQPEFYLVTSYFPLKQRKLVLHFLAHYVSEFIFGCWFYLFVCLFWWQISEIRSSHYVATAGLELAM